MSMYENRVYRRLHQGKNLVYFTASVDQTNLHIGAKAYLKGEALRLIKIYRKQIEDYIGVDKNFLTSLEPVACSDDAPEIIQWMCQAGKKAGVGPMAAVAGAISEKVGKGLLKHSNEIIVENGGDIFIKSDRERVIGIYAGNSPLSEKVGIRIVPENTPLGVCTSAGKIGHSLSFGKADAVMILSKDTALADAVATAAGNRVKSAKDINDGISFAKDIPGVLGVVIIFDDGLGVWGDIHLVAI